jgi:hypothetical protein
LARLTYDLALAGYRWEKAREHPRYFLPWVAAPDSRSGDLFHFATVSREEAADLEIPFMGKEFQVRGTARGESSWLWQRDYLDWIMDNPFTVTLKARQLGVSWIWDATILWDLIFFPGVDDLIYSIKEEDAIEQVNRIWDIWLTVPEWMKEMAGLTVLKPFGAARPSSRIEFEHPDGRVSTVTGMPATKKAGHSRVARRVLFDEGAHQEFARQIWKAIIPAAGDAGGNIGAVSTANGVSDGHGGGNFFHEVYTGAGGVEYPNVKAIFLPWHNHPARTQEWYEGLNLDKQSKAEQYPEDDDEAFLLTGSPFFDLTALQYYSRAARVEPQLQGEWVYFHGPRNKARFQPEEGGVLEVYRRPEKGHDYVLGADVATGMGTDYSVAVVLDLADGAPCAQIRMKADYAEFARQVHFTAEWYEHALVGIEKGGGYGDTVIAYLRDGHEGRKSYINLYRHRAYDDRKRKLKAQYGFPMSATTRPKVVSELAKWVNGKQLPWVPRRFAVEARSFVRRDTRPSPRAADGANDDAVLALGIALEMYSLHGQHRHDVRKTQAAPEGFRERSVNDPRVALMKNDDPRSRA